MTSSYAEENNKEQTLEQKKKKGSSAMRVFRRDREGRRESKGI
jgi:hypothetical protein